MFVFCMICKSFLSFSSLPFFHFFVFRIPTSFVSVFDTSGISKLTKKHPRGLIVSTNLFSVALYFIVAIVMFVSGMYYRESILLLILPLILVLSRFEWVLYLIFFYIYLFSSFSSLPFNIFLSDVGAGGIVFIILALLHLLLLILWRNRIAFAGVTLQYAGNVISKYSSVVTLAFVVLAMQVCFSQPLTFSHVFLYLFADMLG